MIEFENVDPNNPRRDFNICTYYPCNVFKPILERYGKYIYIFHAEDNTEPHYHIALKTQNNLKLSTLHDLIDYEYSLYCEEKNIPYQRQRLTAKPLRDNKIETAVDYYLHTNEDSVKKNKHKYSFDDLHGNFDINSLQKKENAHKPPTEEANAQFYFDLLDRSYKTRSEFLEYMGKTYGRDFIKNYHSYEDYRLTLRYEKKEDAIEADLDNIGNLQTEYEFIEQSPPLSVEAYRHDLIKKLEYLNRRYPKPEFKVINPDDIKYK